MNQVRSRRGAALVIVLLGLAVIATLATAAIERSNAHLLVIKHITKTNAAVPRQHAAAEIAAARLEADTFPIGKPVPVTVEGHHLTVTATNVNGLVDVNTADHEVLEALFAGFGVEGAGNLADTVVAMRESRFPWRMPDGLVADGVLTMETFWRVRSVLTTGSGLKRPLVAALSEKLGFLVRVAAERSARGERNTARLIRVEVEDCCAGALVWVERRVEAVRRINVGRR